MNVKLKYLHLAHRKHSEQAHQWMATERKKLTWPHGRMTRGWPEPNQNQEVFDFTSSPLSIKEAWIPAQARWFLGTGVHPLLSLLAFWIKSLFLAPTTCLSIYWPVVRQPVWAWTQWQDEGSWVHGRMLSSELRTVLCPGGRASVCGSLTAYPWCLALPGTGQQPERSSWINESSLLGGTQTGTSAFAFFHFLNVQSSKNDATSSKHSSICWRMRWLDGESLQALKEEITSVLERIEKEGNYFRRPGSYLHARTRKGHRLKWEQEAHLSCEQTQKPTHKLKSERCVERQTSQTSWAYSRNIRLVQHSKISQWINHIN